MRTIPSRGIPVFLAIAFGLAWAPFLPVLFGGTPVAVVFMPFAPAVACFVVRRWVTREGFSDAGLRHRLRQGWRLYFIAALWPLLAAPVAVVLVINIGHGASPGMQLPWGMAPPG
jgi:uncharacterized protein